MGKNGVRIPALDFASARRMLDQDWSGVNVLKSNTAIMCQIKSYLLSSGTNSYPFSDS
jgi:hypothetical protein